ncbi:hypothetical protein RND81_10G184800 [Saponaria officinalis]|uniref:SET domain-containing protein n=1 Tax=Saponaria officinalis TaxID=3572 RepID=A0AAW1I3K6_SAPOF
MTKIEQMPLASLRSLNPHTILRTSKLLTVSHQFLPKFCHTAPPHNLNILKCCDNYSNEFLPWLDNKAGVRISSLLSIGISNFGRCLFACKNVQAGDCLLKVPFSVQITPDNLLPEIKPMIPDEVGNIAKLAVVILVKQKKGQLSEWAPYITRLPQIEDMHITIFWNAQELKMIRHSSVYQETLNQQAQIKNDFLALKPVLDSFPQFFKDVSFENFRHAYGLVASRAWGSTKGLSLIPFADFLNHDGSSKSFVLSDEDKQISEVIADRNYGLGEEVLIRYGKFPNSTLLLDFGFTVPYNNDDQVCVQFDLTSDDHLRAMKLDLLQKHSLPKMKGVSFSSSDGSFVIKKVRSSDSKGKGIPQSLRAFARVMCCNSSQELDELAVEAAQHDGRLARRPLANRSLEMQAHKILLSRVNDVIDTHSVSIESVTLCSPYSHLSSPTVREAHSDRKWLETSLLARYKS